MPRPFPLAFAVLLAAGPLGAQDASGACTTPDTLVVRGNTRVSASSILSDAAVPLGTPLNFRTIQRSIESLYATGQFADVKMTCLLDAGSGRTQMVITVAERLVLGDVGVEGVREIAERTVRERIDVLIGRPIDPAQVARIVSRIDSLYEASGYYLARIVPETTVVAGRTKLTFRIDEGRRLAVSGIRISGNSRLGDGQIARAMKTRPEGFWWFRRGEFDDDKYAADLAERLPALYGKNGYVDFQILSDTVIIDRERGKALIDLTVSEGPHYRVGEFEVTGNHRFDSEAIARFYPFTREAPSLTERVRGLIGRRGAPTNVFDQARWDEATQRVQTAYSNEGYIYAQVRPVVERVSQPDSTHLVNLRWDIEERSPAIVNRVEILGNDYTTEACIRQQLQVVPGDVFNQDRLIRSYQSISNLGFFETPIPPPDTRQANEQGDVDILFRVKEKRTGSVNFGASVGQGTGLGGFIGLTQPNVFGLCKQVSLNWQFGNYINDFNISYTDPNIQQRRVSGTVNAYRTQSRFRIANLGRSTRTGGLVRFGFPIPRSPFSRVFVSYGGESVKYGSSGLLGSVASGCERCFRSTLGFTGTHDTQIDLPFPTAGGMQTFSAEFNGGPLGGTASFQRYTTELRSWAPLGQFGGNKPGSQPVKFVLGLTARAGSVFGDPGPFFYSQKFALGGTQFGEQLRGYEEFSISPRGFVTGTNSYSARVESFGSAFFSTTAQVGVRFNQMFYVSGFFDAGNVWRRPREFDPTRLYRGAGVGISTITPLGPLGLDWAYGFDRLNAFGRRDPRWQLHFKLGQLF